LVPFLLCLAKQSTKELSKAQDCIYHYLFKDYSPAGQLDGGCDNGNRTILIPLNKQISLGNKHLQSLKRHDASQ
jgi:hypothetical protein